MGTQSISIEPKKPRNVPMEKISKKKDYNIQKEP